MIITNAKVITWGSPNRILEDHALFIEGDRILEIGPQAELARRHPHPAPVDAHGQYVMPGNICAHTHFYGAFARGLAIPGEAPAEFKQILDKLWWPLDKALTHEDVKYSRPVAPPFRMMLASTSTSPNPAMMDTPCSRTIPA